jgi:hypothetical protein
MQREMHRQPSPGQHYSYKPILRGMHEPSKQSADVATEKAPAMSRSPTHTPDAARYPRYNLPTHARTTRVAYGALLSTCLSYMLSQHW